MNLHFQHIEYLLALGIIPVLVLVFLWLLQWKKKTREKIGDAGLISQLTRSFSSTRFLVKFVLVLGAVTCIIVGCATLRQPGSGEKVPRKGVDVVIALDVSKSMLAGDIKPTRLDKAKQLANKLLDALQNDRVGLVVFAGHAYLQMPVSTDHSAAKMYIQNASTAMVPTQGTVISDALSMSNTAFNSNDRKYKAIILITDGEDHDPQAAEVAKKLTDNGVMINTVGIGTPDGAPIKDPDTDQMKRDAQGNTVVSKLNEAELQQLAGETSGVYIRLTDTDEAVATIQKKLSTIEQTSLEDNAFLDYIHYFQWFLGAALCLLLAEFLLPEHSSKKAEQLAGA